MLKLAGGVLLEDSARQRPEGYYAHGEYPFVVTSLYPRRGSCLGFGLVDMFENQQLYSDKLDQIVLKNALMARGIEVLDASDPRTLGITDCEFLDGLRVGEVGCDRILHELTNRWPELLSYVNMEKLNRVLNEWPGHAWVRDERVSDAFETDFLKMGCLKKTP